MKKRKIIPAVLLVVSIITFVIYNVYFREDVNSSLSLSKYGSRGDEVKQIQTKLKRWGYYYGNIDGIYGTQKMVCRLMELQGQKHFQQWELHQVQTKQEVIHLIMI